MTWKRRGALCWCCQSEIYAECDARLPAMRATVMERLKMMMNRQVADCLKGGERLTPKTKKKKTFQIQGNLGEWNPDVQNVCDDDVHQREGT